MLIKPITVSFRTITFLRTIYKMQSQITSCIAGSKQVCGKISSRLHGRTVDNGTEVIQCNIRINLRYAAIIPVVDTNASFIFIEQMAASEIAQIQLSSSLLVVKSLRSSSFTLCRQQVRNILINNRFISQRPCRSLTIATGNTF